MLDALAVDRARIADIDAQILELRNQKISVQERLDSYTYPVLTLPNEIVAEIFIHFLPIYPICPPLTGILSPTVLTQICRTWREIAQATPGLWRAIHLSSTERQLHGCHTWLTRSRCCPLSVQITDSDNALCKSEAISDVVHHQARWEHLNLRLTRCDLPGIEATPLLRTLYLRIYSDFEAFTFHEAPLLRTVFLHIAPYRNIVLPWAQLTSLTMLFIYPRECVPILQQASNLVHCRLDILFGSESDQPGVIPLPALESLSLDKLGIALPANGYLETFILPALHTLRIAEGILEPDPVRSLTSFISKSGCKLENIHITDRTSVAESSYREAFSPMTKLCFGE